MTVEPSKKVTRRTLRIEFSSRTLLAILLTVTAIWLLHQLWPILVVIASALILVGTLNPLVEWLQTHRVKRVWAVAIIFLGSALLVTLLGLLTIPPLVREVTHIVQNLPELQESLAAKLEAHRLTAPVAETVRHSFAEKATKSFDVMSALAVSLSVFEVLGYLVTTVVLAIYFIVDSERMRGTLYALVPRRYHLRLARVLLNLEVIVGGYLRGQVITSLAIGVFTFALLSICRVPNALALAAFAGLTDVIPFIGGLLATTPAVLSSLSRGTLIMTVVLAAMIGYQEFESRVLVPRIYGRVLRLPSAAVVVALLIGGKLGGIIGALLALPVAAGLRMLVEELRVELPGDDTDDRALRARDEHAEKIYERRTVGASPEEAAAVATNLADQIRKSDASDAKEAAKVPITDGK